MKRQRQAADRLGTLPDETLQRILRHLPSDQAVRTSALSRRWRHVHAAVPVVHVADHKKGGYDRPRYGKDGLPVCFDQKVTGAFLCKAPGTPIHTLRLDVCRAPHNLIDQWIVSAVYFGAQEIDVKLDYGPNRRRLCPFASSAAADFHDYRWNPYLKTQHHIFRCRTLRRLRLTNWTLDLPSKSMEMASLHTLCLTRIMDQHGLLPRLLSNCPRLLHLTLKECPSVREISVKSACLRSFAMICCHRASRVMLHSTCLESLHYKGDLPNESLFRIADYRGIVALTIEICQDLSKTKSTEEVAPVATLISRCSELIYLHLNLRPSMAYDSRVFAEAVHRLPIKQLSLEGCVLDDHAVRSVAVLLRETENLEVISLFLLHPQHRKKASFSILSDSESSEDTESEEGYDDGVGYSNRVTDSLWDMYIKCLEHNKVRRINIVNYKGWQLEKILAKVLLYRCGSLKEFSVTLGNSQHKDEIERKLRSWRSSRRTRLYRYGVSPSCSVRPRTWKCYRCFFCIHNIETRRYFPYYLIVNQNTEPEDGYDDGIGYSSRVTNSLWNMYIKCLDNNKLRRINIVNYKGLQFEKILAKFLLYRCGSLKEFSVTLGNSQHKDGIKRELRSWRSNRQTSVTVN